MSRWSLDRLVVCAAGAGLCLSCMAKEGPKPQWVGTWAASPMLADGGYRVHVFSAVTLREIVHISAGGDRVRVRFTN